MILTALAVVAIPTLLMAADEARLMRFPATNGSEIVFSYAGDLYKVPATGEPPVLPGQITMYS